jgi:hypothetical protein
LHELKHRALDPLSSRDVEPLHVDLADDVGDGDALQGAIDDPWVDVGGATRGRRIPEVLGDLLDHLGHRPAPGSDALDLRAREERRGEHGRLPRAEVLRRKVVAGQRLKVAVDIARPDVVPAPVLFIRQELAVPVVAFLECAHHAGQARIFDHLDAALPALGGEVERHLRTLDLHVPSPDRRQTERAVVSGIRLAPRPEGPFVQQPHREREGLVLRGSARPERAIAVGTDRREGLGEPLDPVELLDVPA